MTKKYTLLPLILGANAVFAQDIPQGLHIQGNCNAVGNNNTVTCSWARPEFSETLGQELLAKMPDKKKTVALNTIGGNKDQSVGNQVQKYLKEHGYAVERSINGMQSTPPDEPFVLQVNGNQYVLTVAPSAH